MNLEKVSFGSLITPHFSSLFSLIKIILFRRMKGWEGWDVWHVACAQQKENALMKLLCWTTFLVQPQGLLDPWIWNRYTVPKRQWQANLRRATTQNREFLNHMSLTEQRNSFSCYTWHKVGFARDLFRTSGVQKSGDKDQPQIAIWKQTRPMHIPVAEVTTLSDCLIIWIIAQISLYQQVCCNIYRHSFLVVLLALMTKS